MKTSTSTSCTPQPQYLTGFYMFYYRGVVAQPNKIRMMSSFVALVLLSALQVSSSDDRHHNFQEDKDILVHDEDDVVVMDTGLDGVFSTGGQKLKVSSPPPKLEWDPNGYFSFCPCMGRFGNQAEHYLGSLAYGKAMNRTIILPPFRTRRGTVPFSDWFQVEHLRAFHTRVITMETFMAELAPTHWPEDKRTGYCCCWVKNKTCGLVSKENSSSGVWNAYDISFVEEEERDFMNHADISDEKSMAAVKEMRDKDLPGDEHPVVMLSWAPAPFPMKAGNRIIQRHFKWKSTIFNEAYHHMDQLFNGEPFVGIHLRTGPDWEKGCVQVQGLGIAMASSQCREIGKEPVTMSMCYPTKEMVLEETRAAVEKYKTKHVFIATDKLSYQTELQKMFGDEVKVHHLDPEVPQIDLIILGQSDFFIGNCVSSFTSFVKRERDANGKPSTFWSFGV